MGYTPLESIKRLSFATITNAIGSIAKAINLTPKAQIHTAIQDGKYAATMRTRQSIIQSATGAKISADVNWSL